MRGPEDVACSHCKQIGAAATCSICQLQVCERCQDPLTCTEPVGRTYTLPRAARVRALSPRGRLALVSMPFRNFLVLDLRTASWLGEVPMPLHVAPTQMTLTDDARLLYRELPVESVSTSAAVCMIDAHTGAMLWSDRLPSPSPALLGVAPTQKYVWYTTGSFAGTRIRLLRTPYVLGDFETLAGNAILNVAVDAERDVLATGGDGAIALHRITQNGLHPLAIDSIPAGNKLEWIGAVGDQLIMIVAVQRARFHVEIRDLATSLRPGRVRAALPLGTFVGASLSHDRGSLVVAIGATIHVVDLQSDTPPAMLEEHTNEMTCMTVGERDTLISADCDRRIIVRPRGVNGVYTRDLIPQELPPP